MMEFYFGEFLCFCYTLVKINKMYRGWRVQFRTYCGGSFSFGVTVFV